MSGLAERPTPLTNSATGMGLFSLEGNTLTFNVSYSGLSGAAISAHIHGPAAASGSAPVLVNLAPYNGGSFGIQGVLAGSATLTPAQRAAILAGQTYVNIHTPDKQSGELRGQIAPVLMTASLNGANERPNPVATSATGSATLVLVGNQLTFNITYRNLTSVGNNAHIHGPASVFASAPPLVDLVPFNGGAFGMSGSLAGTVTLNPNALASLVDGLTYINVHTPTNAPGEIRGQITR